ncbi:hypothetical protein J25TS5_01540 [Paenibacillus faecis]|uniref:DUF4179 domain-containing protein n=1 Tax=Paenibacillus faecis TaxID=862114 RepID=UPI001B1E16D4|nr:DUF4179 domain-containing protein [Paenibacillus faecis]GIO83222.1 hypothetical protein J25TS5_01540 [Paenibacillus faecis]
MLDVRNELDMKKEIEQSLDRLTAPESLRDFARNIAWHSENKKPDRRRAGRRPWVTGFVAGAAAVSLLFVTAEMSPAFASMLKQIPGVSVAAEWLDTLRRQDGVENAAAHKYMPFEPVVQQFGDIKVSLADVYLTSDKLMYKAFIRTDTLKEHIAKNPDGSLSLDRTADFYAVESVDFDMIEGSASEDLITDQETGEPILVISNIIDLEPEAVQAFLQGNPDTLRFEIYAGTHASGRADRQYAMKVPFSPDQQLKDRIIQANRRIEVKGDPDIGAVVLDNIRVTPLNTYAELRLDNSAEYSLDLRLNGDGKEDPVKLTDNNGKVYPLVSYETKYQPVHDRFQPGVIKLTFNSSPFFDETVDRLTLHVGAVEVSDWTKSDSFTLDLNEPLPKPIRFKNKEMTITETRYEDGFLKLKVRQKSEDRMSVRFDIPSLRPDKEKSPELWEAYYGEKADLRKERIMPTEGNEEYELAFMVPKQDTYEIRVKREADPVRIDRTIAFDLR